LRLELSYTLAHARDSEGYSPLLDNASIRQTDRHSMRAQLSMALNKKTQLIFNAEQIRHNSNLALFRQSGKSISFGMQQQF